VYPKHSEFGLRADALQVIHSYRLTGIVIRCMSNVLVHESTAADFTRGRSIAVQKILLTNAHLSSIIFSNSRSVNRPIALRESIVSAYEC
jgi:hypothetical protein